METSFSLNIGRIEVVTKENEQASIDGIAMAGGVKYNEQEMRMLLASQDKMQSALGNWVDHRFPAWMEDMFNKCDAMRKRGSNTRREIRRLDDEAHRQQLDLDQKAAHDRQREQRSFLAETEKAND